MQQNTQIRNEPHYKLNNTQIIKKINKNTTRIQNKF